MIWLVTTSVRQPWDGVISVVYAESAEDVEKIICNHHEEYYAEKVSNLRVDFDQKSVLFDAKCEWDEYETSYEYYLIALERV